MNNQLENIPTNENPTDIFNQSYEGGLGQPQAGKFSVWASKLDAEGNEIGGGWVESFESEEEAEQCRAKIEEINPQHAPKIEKQ